MSQASRNRVKKSAAFSLVAQHNTDNNKKPDLARDYYVLTKNGAGHAHRVAKFTWVNTCKVCAPNCRFRVSWASFPRRWKNPRTKCWAPVQPPMYIRTTYGAQVLVCTDYIKKAYGVMSNSGVWIEATEEQLAWCVATGKRWLAHRPYYLYMTNPSVPSILSTSAYWYVYYVHVLYKLKPSWCINYPTCSLFGI